MPLKKGEIIPLTVDFMFTSIFNKKENIRIVDNFISMYFNIPLKEVKGNVSINSRELTLERKNQARRSVDLLLDYKGKKINIELSNKMSKGVMERNIVYVCSIHARQLKKGDRNYKNIEKTIQINLNHFECNEKNIKEEYYLMNEEGKKLSEKLEIDMIDMEKGRKVCYTNGETKLSRWCMVFSSRNEEELKRALGDDLMEKEASEKLKEEVEKLSSEEEYVELYTELSKEEMERNTYIEEAKEEGMQQGMQKEKRKIALNMLEHNDKIEYICKITGLMKEEIESLTSKSNF